MNQLDKIDFTLYLRKGQKYKFLKYINDYSDEKDLFISSTFGSKLSVIESG